MRRIFCRMLENIWGKGIAVVNQVHIIFINFIKLTSIEGIRNPIVVSGLERALTKASLPSRIRGI